MGTSKVRRSFTAAARNKKKKQEKPKLSAGGPKVRVSAFAHPAIIVYADDAVRDAAKIMRDKETGSVIVSEKASGEPIGILTEWDLLTRVLAADRDIERTRIREVMSEPLLKIEAGASVEDATRLMINRGIRRLAVVEDGVVVGILSQSDLVRNAGHRRASSIPIVERIGGHQCDFCNSKFSTFKELTAHVETMHKETLYLQAEEKQELET